jgi:hypothetical protein
MNDSEGNPLSFEQSLLFLVELLTRLPTQELVQTLGEIGGILYENTCDKANEILFKKYSYAPWIKIHPLLKESNGTENFLFTLHAMRLLNTLLVFDCAQGEILNSQRLVIQNGIHFPLTAHSHNANRLQIFDLFLLSNQLISYIQNDLVDNEDKFLSNIPIYYSQVLVDTNAAIGRSQHLYNTDYFNQKLTEGFGVSVLELSEYLFILFSHVNVHKPAKIELATFRRIINNDQKEKMAKILDFLSIEVKSKGIEYSQIASDLRQDFIQDKICRGKPFLKIGERYVCIRPDLLTSVFGNFPYYYLLNSLSKEKKEEFFKEFGIAFEKYIEIISKRVLDEKSDIYTYKKKPYQGTRSADRHLIINDQSRAIIEIKSSREDDGVMLGSLEDLLKKFIYLGGTDDKPKGVFQLIKDAEKYRNDTFYCGKIFTIIIFYGNFPETNEFDELVHNEINAKPQYLKYLKDIRNFPTIWLSSTTAELIFTAVTQKASLDEILTRISFSPPSKVRSEILNYISEKKLKSSLSFLFIKELNLLLEKSTKMISQD